MKRQTTLYFQKTGILLAVYLALRYLLPLILPFFLAWTTVALLRALASRLGMRLLPLSLCYLAAFVLLCALGVFCGCRLLYGPCLELLPQCRKFLAQTGGQFTWLTGSLSGQAAERIPGVCSCAFGLILYLISVILFARDWTRFSGLLERIPFYLPLSRAAGRLAQSLKGWAKAQCRISLVIIAECAAGYYLLRIPGFLLWAALTGLVDALPILGTGTVFLPWILIDILRQDFANAGWLGVLYAVTWLTRELLEPKLLGDGLGLLPVCFLASAVAGLRLFGASGLFSGPFGVLLVRELWAELEMSAPPENS